MLLWRNFDMGASQKMRHLVYASAAMAIFPIFVCAQGETGPDPIRRLLGCSSAMQMQELDFDHVKAVNGDASAATAMQNGMQAVRKCSGSALPEALKEAGDNAALTEAIKTFYIKDGAYVDSVVSGNRRMTEHERSEAASRLIMEMKLLSK